LGKDAKGLKEKIEKGNNSSEFIFYTPKELLEALTRFQYSLQCRYSLENKLGDK